MRLLSEHVTELMMAVDQEVEQVAGYSLPNSLWKDTNPIAVCCMNVYECEIERTYMDGCE